MMMTGSCGESCAAVAAKYAVMISSNKNMAFLLKVDLTHTAREEGQASGNRSASACSQDRA
jgi:hypothetical protein